MPLRQWTHDLTNGQGASQRLRDWLHSLNPTDFAGITLINNAGAKAGMDHFTRCMARFAQLKEKGLLSSAPQAAAQVLAYLARPDFGQNPVADVRD